VGLELDEAARRALVEAQRALSDFDRVVRWIPEANLHLTLKFLGEVPEDAVEDTCEAVRRAASESSLFSFALKGLGCFPPKGPARIVWAGVEPQGGGLLECQEAVEKEMAEAGFQRESRPYSPHLTIGRVRAGRNTRDLRGALQAAEFEAPTQRVRELVLFESTLSPKGAVYTAVIRAPLGQ
jgi:2'-5' RNA ligase